MISRGRIRLAIVVRRLEGELTFSYTNEKGWQSTVKNASHVRHEFWDNKLRQNIHFQLIPVIESDFENFQLVPDEDTQRYGKPLPVAYRNNSFWSLKGGVWIANDPDLTLDDVLALINVKANQRRMQLEKAHAIQAMVKQLDGGRKRTSIPQAVRLEVWQRDGGRCVECQSQENLEYDHLIPHSMGGSSSTRNLQLLCESCNRRKGASLG